MNSKNETLNFIKGIACIAVVFIHIPFPGGFGQAIVGLARFAVAFFFFVQGYFLYSDDYEVRLKKLRKRIKHILLITLMALIIYFVWESFVRFWGGGVEKVIAWYFEDVFTLKKLFQVIVLSYDPYPGHLWFLIALLEAYLIFILVIKIRKLNKIGILLGVLSLILLEAHIITALILEIKNIHLGLHIFRNAWFYAFPVMMLGYIIKWKEEWIFKHIKSKFLLVALGLGIIFTFIERFLIGNLQLFQGSVIITFSLFILATRYPNIRFTHLISIIGDKFSSDIYIYHWLIIEIFIKIQKEIYLGNWFDWISPVLVFCVTLLLAWVLMLLKQTIRKIRQKIDKQSIM